MMTIMCDLYCVGPHLRAVERKQERGGGGSRAECTKQNSYGKSRIQVFVMETRPRVSAACESSENVQCRALLHNSTHYSRCNVFIFKIMSLS